MGRNADYGYLQAAAMAPKTAVQAIAPSVVSLEALHGNVVRIIIDFCPGDATALCGKDSAGGKVSCPLNVCCSIYGYCGVSCPISSNQDKHLTDLIDRFGLLLVPQSGCPM